MLVLQAPLLFLLHFPLWFLYSTSVRIFFVLPVTCHLLLFSFSKYPLFCSHQPCRIKSRASFPFASLKCCAVNNTGFHVEAVVLEYCVIILFFLFSLSGWLFVMFCTYFYENHLNQLAARVSRDQSVQVFIRSTLMHSGRDCKLCNSPMWQQSHDSILSRSRGYSVASLQLSWCLLPPLYRT